MTTATPIADMITEMLKNCIPMETIIMAVRTMERAMSTRQKVDPVAERRREWDREYRRKKRARPPDPPDFHPKTPDVGVAALSTKEKILSIEKIGRKSAGTKLPPDWRPSAKHYAEGAKLGMSAADVDERATAMRNWCEANANRAITTKANWDAAFLGAWLKQGYRNGKTQTANNPRAGSLIAALDRRIAATAIEEESDREVPADHLLGLPSRSIL